MDKDMTSPCDRDLHVACGYDRLVGVERFRADGVEVVGVAMVMASLAKVAVLHSQYHTRPEWQQSGKATGRHARGQLLAGQAHSQDLKSHDRDRGVHGREY